MCSTDCALRHAAQLRILESCESARLAIKTSARGGRAVWEGGGAAAAPHLATSGSFRNPTNGSMAHTYRLSNISEASVEHSMSSALERQSVPSLQPSSGDAAMAQHEAAEPHPRSARHALFTQQGSTKRTPASEAQKPLAHSQLEGNGSVAAETTSGARHALPAMKTSSGSEKATVAAEGDVVPAAGVPQGVYSLGKRDLLRQAWQQVR